MTEEVIAYNATPAIPDELLDNIRTRARAYRSTKTPKQSVYTRKGKGNQSFTYIKRAYAQKWLDENYPGWSWEVLPESFQNFAGYVQVAGRLTVIEPEGLKRVVVTYGQDEAIVSEGDLVPIMYAKSAESDALKRAVQTVGCANDIYHPTEEFEAAIDEDQDEWFIERVLPKLKNKDNNYLYKITKNFILGKLTAEYLQKHLENL